MAFIVWIQTIRMLSLKYVEVVHHFGQVRTLFLIFLKQVFVFLSFSFKPMQSRVSAKELWRNRLSWRLAACSKIARISKIWKMAIAKRCWFSVGKFFEVLGNLVSILERQMWEWWMLLYLKSGCAILNLMHCPKVSFAVGRRCVEKDLCNASGIGFPHEIWEGGVHRVRRVRRVRSFSQF